MKMKNSCKHIVMLLSINCTLSLGNGSTIYKESMAIDLKGPADKKCICPVPDTCNCCADLVQYLPLCAKAQKVGNGDIDVTTTFAGEPIMHGKLAANRNPVGECFKVLDISMDAEMCLDVDDFKMNAGQMSGCVTCNVKFAGATDPVPLGCFNLGSPVI